MELPHFAPREDLSEIQGSLSKTMGLQAGESFKQGKNPA